ncbi:hypothetical protein J2Z31_005568 [Sinorhizobium kostiense]|uniref:Transposase n=1 Tax=Sinorhizobium kostiense TaxID=76747 RepID=A0ABS4RB32_9HYPH|nr:hypothetical protein [Sinorhizobium kostiense]
MSSVVRKSSGVLKKSRLKQPEALVQSSYRKEIESMMGEQSVMQEELFYGFSLEQHVPADHLLRAIDRFVDLSGVRQHLAP